ncbi:MAG: MarR family transcriptional regulator [Burkholderiaceae bacterium]|nr:MarR family transcriptional regulator [Burkholderiaceae bacterium]
MSVPDSPVQHARMEIANRLFFKLYQCANLMHKTGTKAVESEGLTTQQWAVLGALTRSEARNGMSMGDLARYLMVSRQNLTGVIGRLERDGRIRVDPDPRDRRSRLIRMTEEGEQVWHKLAVPKIHRFYADALDGFAMTDLVHTTHYLMKLLDNMERLDGGPQDD